MMVSAGFRWQAVELLLCPSNPFDKLSGTHTVDHNVDTHGLTPVVLSGVLIECDCPRGLLCGTRATGRP